jgi:hypothetical protein
LRSLHRFYHLPQWLAVPPDQIGKHGDVTKALRSLENEIRLALIELGMTPLKIEFLTPLAEDLSPYVDCSERALSAYYPLADRLAQGGRGVILDAPDWGYLDAHGHLWGGKKAQLIISR